jgi:hypothetical protein
MKVLDRFVWLQPRRSVFDWTADLVEDSSFDLFHSTTQPQDISAHCCVRVAA